MAYQHNFFPVYFVSQKIVTSEGPLISVNFLWTSVESSNLSIEPGNRGIIVSIVLITPATAPNLTGTKSDVINAAGSESNMCALYVD